MDKEKEEARKQRWDWLPQHMPGVVKLMSEKKRELGPDWVNECWRHGVVQGEPGWFFAGEGALMVGTMWDDAAVIAFAAARVTRSQALVVLRPKEASHAGQ